MAEAPKIEQEVRIPRVRTSISIPQDVDVWVRWKAAAEGVPISYVYALAVSRWADQESGATVQEGGRDPQGG